MSMFTRRRPLEMRTAASLIVLALLAGCNPALQWRRPPEHVRDKVVCEVRGGDRRCVRMTNEEFQRVLDDLMRTR